MAQPDQHRCSRKVEVSEFTGKYSSLRLGNGGSWCRDDGSGSLAKDYDIHRIKEGNKIVAIQLTPKKSYHYSSKIKPEIKSRIKKKNCVVLGIKGKYIECDHKDGFKVIDIAPENQTDDLFQPMHKSVNLAKRDYCKKCKKTRIRFDAKKLGYNRSYWKGKNRFEGSCEGCYWHDPYAFNQNI